MNIPKDPNYKTRVADSFAAQSAMTSMNISLILVEPGQIVMQLEKTDAFLQQQGFLHGGVITSGLDSACGFAALSLAAPGFEVLTIEFKTSFLAPGRAKLIRFEGQVIKSGRRISFCEASAYENDGDNKKMIAKMSTSLAMVEMPAGWQPLPKR